MWWTIAFCFLLYPPLSGTADNNNNENNDNDNLKLISLKASYTVHGRSLSSLIIWIIKSNSIQRRQFVKMDKTALFLSLFWFWLSNKVFQFCNIIKSEIKMRSPVSGLWSSLPSNKISWQYIIVNKLWRTGGTVRLEDFAKNAGTFWWRLSIIWRIIRPFMREMTRWPESRRRPYLRQKINVSNRIEGLEYWALGQYHLSSS